MTLSSFFKPSSIFYIKFVLFADIYVFLNPQKNIPKFCKGSSVIIHDDKPQEADDPFKIYEEEIHFQEDNEPLTEVEKSSTFEEKDEEKDEGGGGGTDLGVSTYDNVHRETSNGFNEEDIQEEEEQQKRGSHDDVTTK
ncbi:unnamed protein product [Meloidogyne enterolobii]|uniref:Uncharacterized protein n=1 Tax=Meloidogyne enterolobii TaxID=390850 RepID=A0ACB0Z9P5_MELEN